MVDQLPSLTDADQLLLFSQYGRGPSQPSPFTCVHHAFEHHAREQPDAIAIEHLADTISFSRLDSDANRLAHRLRQAGVLPGTRVVLLAQRSIPFVTAILAILKAGGAYVPLDGAIVTDSTLAYVISDSNAILTLCMREYMHRVPADSVLCLEDSLDSTSVLPQSTVSKPTDLSQPSDSLYVIYTSGTTGKPKGVDVMHYNATNLICLSPGNLGMRPGLRVSQFLNIAFDMAQWEVLGSLANGATLCIRGRTSREWKAVMKTVDIVIATPSIMMPHDPVDYPNIKVVATAGEVCPQVLADRWSTSACFYNCCGPTEITIVNTMQLHQLGAPLSIGTPTPNNTVYILDEDLKPLPIGEVGIMWAGGAGITRGYLNLPEKTAERYRPDPFLQNGMMMFNTGDLGRWRSDGQLDHLGRIDDQVKIKGFRVELDGVAAAMQMEPTVERAAALLLDSELWGFVTPYGVDVDQVKSACAKIQPYYAVPTKYLTLSSFPHTANGKIDKRVLRQMASDFMNTTPKDIVAPEMKALLRDLVFTPYRTAASDKLALVQPLSSQEMSSSLWSELVVAPAMPAPVYQPDFKPFVPAPPMTRSSSLSSSSSTATLQDSNAHSPVLEKEKCDYASSIEKGEWWDGYLEDELPAKNQPKLIRNLRHQIFSLYRRLFGVVFVINMGFFIAILVRGKTNAAQLGQVVIANIFCSILMRQDHVVNAFFNVLCSVPTSWPLALRRVCARVYHIGGLHSGCAVSGVMWLILFTVQATIECVQGGRTSIPTLVVTYLILALLFAIMLFAWPSFRMRFHDRFERSHRFMGWTATALVWIQTILLINDYRNPGESLARSLRTSAPFWLVVVMTASIILPWLKLRRVTVKSEVLSTHAVRLHFDYVTPVAGSFTRISRNPLMEWHSFATIPEPGKTGYSLVVSKAGDWTTNAIQNPPDQLWVRGVPTCGVLRIVPLFRRLIFVATGSGIGPCAPCILEQRVPIRLLWTSPNVRQTFGDKLVDSLLAVSPGAVIYDTRVHGKPDMVKMTMRLFKEFDAEAVCIISNQKLTSKLVYGLTSRGIPAFGAIWDS